MKKVNRSIALVLLSAFLFGFVPTASRAADDNYDPMNTMLALNMAIVSIHKIVSTQDRIVLDQEYNTIINRLALGNIEADDEMVGLYVGQMGFISKKTLRQEEAKRFQERYNRREQRQLIDSLSGIRAYGGSLWSWLGSLATSCVSTYFGYESAKAELREGLDDELWQLKKEDVEDCEELQENLLRASWTLLRQYKLPDDYRLTQESLSGFYKATQEPDPAKKGRMLRALERSFRVYPPYWFYRARAAQEARDEAEAKRCFDKFDEVWRPVLRLDPYKLEAAKFRVWELAKDGAPTEGTKEKIKEQLALIREYTPDGDWANSLFAGVAYFALDDKDEALMCVEPNVDFGYETTVSGAILAQMKAGKLNPESLSGELRALFETMTEKSKTVKKPEPPKEPVTIDSDNDPAASIRGSGLVRVYTTMAEPLAKALFDAFEASTGIQVEWARLSGGEIIARLEATRNNPVASIWIGGVGTQHIEAKLRGLTTPYRSPMANHISEKFRDIDDYWTGLYISPIAFCINTDLARTMRLNTPRSWSDLIRPEYMRKVSVAHPSTSGTGYAVISTIIQINRMNEASAFNYFKKFSSMVDRFTRTGSAPAKRCAIGEIPVAIGYLHDMARLRDQGAPIEISLPQDGTGYEIASMSLINNGPGMSNAKLLYDWMLGRKAMDIVAKWYVIPVSDLSTASIVPITRINLVNQDDVWDAQNFERLRNRWNREISLPPEK